MPINLAAQPANMNPYKVILVDRSGNVVGSNTALTAAAPTAVSVGTASTLVATTAPGRRGLVLTNTDTTNRMSFGVGTTAILNSGITLLAGGVFEMDEWMFTTSAIYAIAATAPSNLAIQEFS